MKLDLTVLASISSIIAVILVYIGGRDKRGKQQANQEKVNAVQDNEICNLKSDVRRLEGELEKQKSRVDKKVEDAFKTMNRQYQTLDTKITDLTELIIKEVIKKG